MELCFRNQRKYDGGHQFCKYFDTWRGTLMLKELFSTVCLRSMYCVQSWSWNFSWVQGREVPTLRLYVTYVYVYKACYKIYDIYIYTCKFHDSLN